MEQDSIQTQKCPYCGEEISINAKKCKHCGEWLSDKPHGTSQNLNQQTPQAIAQPQVIVNQVEQKTNGLGTAGFVVSLICSIFCWVPGVNFVLWFLGLLFSFIGIFKKPRGLAIAGFIIAIIDIIIIVVIIGGTVSLLNKVIS